MLFRIIAHIFIFSYTRSSNRSVNGGGPIIREISEEEAEQSIPKRRRGLFGGFRAEWTQNNKWSISPIHHQVRITHPYPFTQFMSLSLSMNLIWSIWHLPNLPIFQTFHPFHLLSHYFFSRRLEDTFCVFIFFSLFENGVFRKFPCFKDEWKLKFHYLWKSLI